MSKQASPMVIGGFVMGAVALLIAVALIFGTGQFLTEMPTYVLYFEGDMGGLGVGAPVTFRGVKVGLVTDIQVQYDPKDMSVQIPVFIEMEGRVKVADEVEIDPYAAMQEMVERGLRAQLQVQSLVTGQLKVELDFHPDKPIKLLGLESEYRELPTIPSTTEELVRKIGDLPINELFNKLLQTVEGIESVVSSPEVKGSLSSLELTLNDLDKLVRNIDDQIEPLASGIDGAVGDVRKLVQNINVQAEPLLSSIKQSSDEVRVALKEVEKLVQNVDAQVEPLASSIGKSSDEAQATLKQVNKTFSTEDSPLIYELTNTLEELSAAARSLRTVTDYLERHPEALIRGKREPGGD